MVQPYKTTMFESKSGTGTLDKQRKLLFKSIFVLQHDGFVPCEKLTVKGLFSSHDVLQGICLLNYAYNASGCMCIGEH